MLLNFCEGQYFSKRKNKKKEPVYNEDFKFIYFLFLSESL